MSVVVKVILVALVFTGGALVGAKNPGYFQAALAAAGAAFAWVRGRLGHK